MHATTCKYLINYLNSLYVTKCSCYISFVIYIVIDALYKVKHMSENIFSEHTVYSLCLIEILA